MAREKKIASDDDMSITHDSHYQSLQNTVKDCYQKPPGIHHNSSIFPVKGLLESFQIVSCQWNCYLTLNSSWWGDVEVVLLTLHTNSPVIGYKRWRDTCCLRYQVDFLFTYPFPDPSPSNVLCVNLNINWSISLLLYKRRLCTWSFVMTVPLHVGRSWLTSRCWTEGSSFFPQWSAHQ